MRIADYKDLLRERGEVVLFPDEPVKVSAPDPGDAGAGPGLDDMDIGAAEAVELQRVLTAWLELHAALHPAWHQQYRVENPGGPWRSQRAIRAAEDRLRAAEAVLRSATRDLMKLD